MDLLKKIKESDIKDLLNSLDKMTYELSGGGKAGGGEGNLLIKNDSDHEVQLKFLESHIKKIKPKLVLETGTNSGCFSVVLKLVNNDSKIITFGIDSWSKDTTDFINDKFGNFITFIHGDSKITLSEFTTEDTIDMAWVDGDHSYNGALTDLRNCKRLKIKHIFIDDVNLSAEILNAVDTFCEENNISYTEKTNDTRGIIYMKCDWA